MCWTFKGRNTKLADYHKRNILRDPQRGENQDKLRNTFELPEGIRHMLFETNNGI